MTAQHVGPTPAQPHHLVTWAAALAAAALVVIALALALLAVAYALGGSSAIEDNWVGFLGAVALLVGLGASAAGFAMGVAAVAVRHEHGTAVWLALAVFPTLLGLLVLGETLWWE